MIALIAIAAAAAAQPAVAASSNDYRLANPRAIELFERDAALMGWALRLYDANRDGHLSILEADTAAAEFKRIADGDVDGKVTPTEYRSASGFIAARWPTD